MKMTLEHYNTVKAAIDATLARHPDAVERYRAGDFPRADKVKDLQRRFCFDLLYASVPASWVCSELYPYLNDDHIYTALKRACPKL